MCDFHSICCRIDGAIAHVASNSHSEAARAAGWLENDARQRFVEVQWNGVGEMPPISDMIASDAKSDDLTERQVAAITAHYRDLAETLRSGIIAPRLAGPEFADVRYHVADNPSAPEAVLEQLSRDADEWVRRNVGDNPSAPEAVLEQLSRDADTSVRRCVAANPATPLPALEVLSRDADEWVRRRLAANPATPLPALEVLSRDDDEWVRYYVAGNPATPLSA